MGDSAPVKESLTSSRLLAKNSVMNLGVGGLILMLNVLFVPPMLRTFGMELYGVLAITWMVLGHLRWLDLGFSVACAKYVAQDLALGRREHAAVWAWTALTVQAIIGALGAFALWVGAPALVELLKIDPARSDLVILALRMFALVIPFELASRSMNGVLEAAQRFDWINGINVIVALWTFATYGVGILRDGDFLAVIYGLMALKVAQLGATFYVAGRILPSLHSLAAIREGGVLHRLRFAEMLRFGGWVSVSTAFGPLLLYFDRWVISTLRGVAALPLYMVPFQLLWSLSMIPASLSATLFPAFSMMEASTSWDRLERMFIQAHRYLLIGLIPILFTLFVWAPELLRLWIDADFAALAATPFRILIVGFGVGLFAPLSGALLQGTGRPDILAKIYMVELPFNVLITIFLVRQYGIVGAAVSYSLRTVVETMILWIVIYRVFPLSWLRGVREVLGRTGPVAAGLIGLALLLPEASIADPITVAATLTAVTIYAWIVHSHLLDDGDRAFFRDLARRANR
jgi:O-antigen/teichoic acid export membrane protein